MQLIVFKTKFKGCEQAQHLLNQVPNIENPGMKMATCLDSNNQMHSYDSKNRQHKYKYR